MKIVNSVSSSQKSNKFFDVFVVRSKPASENSDPKNEQKEISDSVSVTALDDDAERKQMRSSSRPLYSLTSLLHSFIVIIVTPKLKKT